MSAELARLRQEKWRRQILKSFQDKIDQNLLRVSQKDRIIEEEEAAKIRHEFNTIWRNVRSFAPKDPDRDELRKQIIKDLLQIILKKIKNRKATSMAKLSVYIFPTDKIIEENISSLKGKDVWKKVFRLWWGAIVRKKLLDNEKSQQDVLRSVSQWARRQDQQKDTKIENEFRKALDLIRAYNQEQTESQKKVNPQLDYTVLSRVVFISIDFIAKNMDDENITKFKKMGFKVKDFSKDYKNDFKIFSFQIETTPSFTEQRFNKLRQIQVQSQRRISI